MIAWSKLVVPAFLLLAAGAVAAPTFAQTADQLDQCNGKTDVPPEQRIAGCTAVIQTGKYKGVSLASLYYNRGNANGAKGDYDSAIADYELAIKNNANHAAAFNNRGLAYASKGQYDLAIKDFDVAIQLEPSAVRYYNRGSAYVDKGGDGDFDRAIADYDQAIKLNPDFAAAYNNRGLAYANKGQFAQAIQDYDAAIQRTPSAVHYYNRGLAKRENGDAAGGDADIAQAKTLQPDIADKFAKSGTK